MLPTEESVANADVPELPALGPGHAWHPMVIDWWTAVWRSPMASEYLESDKKDLYLLARLHQDFWMAGDSGERAKAAAEIRQQGVRFGLSPIDRRRLQWEIEKGEQAVEKTQRRKTAKAPPKAGTDPREALKLA